MLETGDGLQVSSGDVKLRDETFSFVLVLRCVVLQMFPLIPDVQDSEHV